MTCGVTMILQSLSNFDFFFTFASPCTSRKMYRDDGTCRAISEINDVTLMRPRPSSECVRIRHRRVRIENVAGKVLSEGDFNHHVAVSNGDGSNAVL